ncbi:MAG: hypothetical protein ACJAUU_000436 [Rickettsiales bacterium]|jgi:hypothetical protein
MIVTFLQFMLGTKVVIGLPTHFEKEPDKHYSINWLMMSKKAILLFLLRSIDLQLNFFSFKITLKASQRRKIAQY